MEEAKAVLFLYSRSFPQAVLPPPSMYKIDGNMFILSFSLGKISRANILFSEVSLEVAKAS